MNNKQVTGGGRPKPPAAGRGRKKGELNKFTRSAKEAFQFAFDRIGGAERLAVWADDNTTEFYKLYGRLIPVEQRVGDTDGKALNFTLLVPPKD